MTTAGLGLLTWGLLLMDALVDIADALVGTELITAPDGARYRVGFTIAVIVNLAGAPALAWLACHTPGRTWPPILQGLAASLLAAIAAGCALLITVGINPVDFVRAL